MLACAYTHRHTHSHTHTHTHTHGAAAGSGEKERLQPVGAGRRMRTVGRMAAPDIHSLQLLPDEQAIWKWILQSNSLAVSSHQISPPNELFKALQPQDFSLWYQKNLGSETSRLRLLPAAFSAGLLPGAWTPASLDV